jgi:hypothetical protein
MLLLLLMMMATIMRVKLIANFIAITINLALISFQMM